MSFAKVCHCFLFLSLAFLFSGSSLLFSADGDAWEEPHADDISPPAVEEVEPQETAEDGEPAEQTTAEAKE